MKKTRELWAKHAEYVKKGNQTQAHRTCKCETTLAKLASAFPLP